MRALTSGDPRCIVTDNSQALSSSSYHPKDATRFECFRANGREQPMIRSLTAAKSG